MAFKCGLERRSDVTSRREFEYFTADGTLSTVDLAKKLLGQLLISEHAEGLTAGWIVETEAYLGALDKSAHVYGGRRTPSLEAFYQTGGIWYIYTIHACSAINVVTQDEKTPEGILIRAIEPVYGIDLMSQRRQRKGRELANGPGKLAQALGVNKVESYGQPVWQKPLWIAFKEEKRPKEIISTARIGLNDKAEEWKDKPLRFIVRGNPYISFFKGSAAENNGWL